MVFSEAEFLEGFKQENIVRNVGNTALFTT